MNLSLTGASETDVFPEIRRTIPSILQINLGYLCNQQCAHCHVGAGPKRTEIMSAETVREVLHFLEKTRIRRIELTGGAPEMNPSFREIVSRATFLEIDVTDRCNLTVLDMLENKDLPVFMARNRVEIVASLPCYRKENVDRQRGDGVFALSIAGLKRLNEVGYGLEGSGLVLNLVYNPIGPVLPPPQEELEMEYRQELADRYGIRFNRLFILTNMPIRRFRAQLAWEGKLESYLTLLRDSFVPGNLEKVMCRTLISVDWKGFLYDCDFNQMLGLPMGAGEGHPIRLPELGRVITEGAPIRTADHCFGCTAGQGSSCGGALESITEEETC